MRSSAAAHGFGAPVSILRTGWLWTTRIRPAVFGGTDNTYVATAFYYYSVMLTAKAAYVLGYTPGCESLPAAGKRDQGSLSPKYFDSKGDLSVKTQTAMVLALYFKLAP